MNFYGHEPRSRLLLGTAQYPSPAILSESIKASGTEIVTVSLRRESGATRAGQDFWSIIRALGVKILPNTAGCHSVKEAVSTAHMEREVFQTLWIKLEVIGDADTLQPDVYATVEAARVLSNDGFEVFPYTTEDLGVAERLLEAGCRVLMPWGAPIGSGRGLNNIYGLRSLRAHFPDVPLIVDAGIGLPSHAAAAMELGFDAVLLNTPYLHVNQKKRDFQRKLRIFQYAEEIGHMAKACRYFGIVRASFYRWKELYKKDGEAGLINKKPIPKNPTNRTPPEVVEKVLHLRQTYHLGPIRIVWYLARYSDIKISDAGVYRILKRNGVSRLPRGMRLHKVHTIRY